MPKCPERRKTRSEHAMRRIRADATEASVGCEIAKSNCPPSVTTKQQHASVVPHLEQGAKRSCSRALSQKAELVIRLRPHI